MESVDSGLPQGGTGAPTRAPATPAPEATARHAGGSWVAWPEAIGLRILAFCRQAVTYAGHIVGTVRGLRSLRTGLVVQYCYSTGVEAVPILLLIGFLMGLTLAMLAAEQLRQFGATIFVADLVAVALAREAGPLMAGVLVAGRSAAGFAAEVGSMKISEEVAALETMGLDVYRYLFTPKVLAAVMVLPFLALVTEAIGILGGFVLGVGTLHLTPRAYLNETFDALKWSDVQTGLVKAAFFGAIIGIVGAAKGLEVKRGAPAVGQAARAAVVLAIILIIITDTIFTAFFRAG